VLVIIKSFKNIATQLMLGFHFGALVWCKMIQPVWKLYLTTMNVLLEQDLHLFADLLVNLIDGIGMPTYNLIHDTIGYF
jgi:hypothetical protein